MFFKSINGIYLYVAENLERNKMVIVNRDILLKSVFPVIIEDGHGVPKLQTGTGFILNYGGFSYVLTAWHCISSFIRKAYGLTDDYNITGDDIRDVIEKYIFFGAIKSEQSIYRIPLDQVYSAVEPIGNRADIFICKVDMESLTTDKKENSSLNELYPLELYSRNLYIGAEYHVWGYPQRFTKIEDDDVKVSFEHRYLRLEKINPAQNNPLTFETGILDFSSTKDTYSTLEGFSGGAVTNDCNQVVGLAYEITNDKKMHFITANSIHYMIQKIMRNQN